MFAFLKVFFGLALSVGSETGGIEALPKEETVTFVKIKDVICEITLFLLLNMLSWVSKKICMRENKLVSTTQPTRSSIIKCELLKSS